MSMSINTNIPALLVIKALAKNQSGMSQTIERLATEYRINSAKDDVAGLAVVQGVIAQDKGLQQAARNANDGLSMLQIAENGLNATVGLLQSMRVLAVQGNSGNYSAAALTAMDTQYQALLNEVDRNSQSVNFNQVYLLDGSATSVTVQVGSNATANDSIAVTFTNVSANSLSINGSNVTSSGNASTAMGTLTTAINTVTTALAAVGAGEARLESAYNENIDISNTLQTAESRIMDADIAQEAAALVRYQILQQTGAAMLVEANAMSRIALTLIAAL